jgi:hypothetical protein
MKSFWIRRKGQRQQGTDSLLDNTDAYIYEDSPMTTEERAKTDLLTPGVAVKALVEQAAAAKRAIDNFMAVVL